MARLRRSWYERHPEARRSLECRVISVGNLSVGGSGKTPVVAAVARLLVQMGERPSILSRGYARREVTDGVVVVSDGEHVLEPVERAGDEPRMLAQTLPGVPVLVSADRYLAGTLAVRRFASTAVILDDGFQYLTLGRNVDVLVMPATDLDGRVLPAGRLREGLDAASSADCIVVPGTDEDVSRVSATFDRMPVFAVAHEFGSLVWLVGNRASPAPGARVVAVAGIARPGRFFTALRDRGYDVVRTLAFADHHWFSRSDLDRISTVARDVRADCIVTTEKDAVRAVDAPEWAVLPMRATIEPVDRFTSWLRDRL